MASKPDISEVTKFNKDQLKSVTVTEKVVLPDNDTIEIEKRETKLHSSIVDPSNRLSLKPVSTDEKNRLPSKEEILQEKNEQATS
jgi:predicted RNA-binding protein with PUA-like domain